jgi:hypothetical protein
MGQGLGIGGAIGVFCSQAMTPHGIGLTKHISIAATGLFSGLAVDLASDIFAKEGKVIVERDVILNAHEVLRHCGSYYCESRANWMQALVRQKHEWVVLESETRRYYVVQKQPSTGDVTIDVRNTVRAANDVGLLAAKQPTGHGEIRLKRADQDFDLPNDLQVAYIIAWARKEDPRWAFSTENSRHMITRLRFALQDF